MINTETTQPETAADHTVARVRKSRLALESFFSHDWKKLDAIIGQLEHNQVNSPAQAMTPPETSALPPAGFVHGDSAPSVEPERDEDEDTSQPHAAVAADDGDRLARLAKVIERRIKTTDGDN